jgi:hypothetical protein
VIDIYDSDFDLVIIDICCCVTMWSSSYMIRIVIFAFVTVTTKALQYTSIITKSKSLQYTSIITKSKSLQYISIITKSKSQQYISIISEYNNPYHIRGRPHCDKTNPSVHCLHYDPLWFVSL